MTEDTKAEARLLAKRIFEDGNSADEADLRQLLAAIDSIDARGEAVAWTVAARRVVFEGLTDWGKLIPSEKLRVALLQLRDALSQPLCASQDGGGAVALAISVFEDVLTDIADWEDKALSEAVQSAMEGLRALRSPLPGRESTAQAGAGEDGYVPVLEYSAEDLVREGSEWFKKGHAAGLAAAPNVLAMREALQELHELCALALAGKGGAQHANLECRNGNFVRMADAMAKAEAALASPLPEPRAGEAPPFADPGVAKAWQRFEAAVDCVSEAELLGLWFGANPRGPMLGKNKVLAYARAVIAADRDARAALAASPIPTPESRWTAEDIARMEKNAEELGKRFATPEPQEGRASSRQQQFLIDLDSFLRDLESKGISMVSVTELRGLERGIGSQDATK